MADNFDATGPEGGIPVSTFEPVRETVPPPVVPAPSEEGPKHPLFPMAMGALLVVLLVIAGGLNSLPAAPSTAAPPAAPAAEPAPPAEPFAKESAVKALEEKLAALESHQKELEKVRDKVESLPKAAPPPDLGAVHAKIAALGKTVDAVGSVPEKVKALQEKIDVVEKSSKSLQDEHAALKAQVSELKSEPKKTGETPKPTADAGPVPKPVDVDVEGQAMSQAVQLFKAGKYKEAGDIFKKVEEEAPKDARVWYYAAITRGMATNDWRGETERLVKKGVEREKAGTPKVAEIDAEFAKISPDTVKSWLDFYRKTAK